MLENKCNNKNKINLNVFLKINDYYYSFILNSYKYKKKKISLLYK